MVKQAAILDHCLSIQDGIERRLDLVLECKAVPANLAGTIVEHARVESAENVGRVVLGVGRADGRFKVGRQVMAVQAGGGFGQSWPISDYQRHTDNFGKAQG